MTEKKKEVNYHRQIDIFDPDKFSDKKITVIGAGGIGSFVVPALTKLGMKNICVWDGDKVEAHNVPNQFFRNKDVGKNKGRAIGDILDDFGQAKPAYTEKMWEGEELEGIVIAAVDSMEVTADNPNRGRKELWAAIKANPKVELFIDGRIGGETIRVLSIRPINDALKHSWYDRNLFGPDEVKELPCTGRSIIDVGYMVAAVIVNLVRRFLKDGEVTHDVVISMKNLTIMNLEVTI